MTHPYFSKIFNSDMEKMETTSHKFTIFWGGKIIAPDSRKVIFNGTLFNAFFCLKPYVLEAFTLFSRKTTNAVILAYQQLMQSNSFTKNCKYAAQGTSSIHGFARPQFWQYSYMEFRHDILCEIMLLQANLVNQNRLEGLPPSNFVKNRKSLVKMAKNCKN